ncbi:DNA primase, partial [Klebsiella pneumoniae]
MKMKNAPNIKFLPKDKFTEAIIFAGEDAYSHVQHWIESEGKRAWDDVPPVGTVAKLAMRQPFVLFKGLTFQKLCLPGAFRPGDHHN